MNENNLSSCWQDESYFRTFCCVNGNNRQAFLYQPIFNGDLSAWFQIYDLDKKELLDTLPELRLLPSFSMDNKYIYMYGGISREGLILNEFWRFSMETYIWEKIHFLSQYPCVYGHTSVCYNNILYIFGGSYPNSVINQIGRYNSIFFFTIDLSTLSFSVHQNSNLSLDLLESSYLKCNEQFSHIASYSSSFVYNSEWRLKSIPCYRTNATSFIYNNTIILIGGYDVYGHYIRDIWEYQTSTVTWKLVYAEESLHYISAGTACYLLDDDIIFFGGLTPIVSVFNLKTQAWKGLIQIDIDISLYHSIIALQDEKSYYITIFGGFIFESPLKLLNNKDNKIHQNQLSLSEIPKIGLNSVFTNSQYPLFLAYDTSELINSKTYSCCTQSSNNDVLCDNGISDLMNQTGFIQNANYKQFLQALNEDILFTIHNEQSSLLGNDDDNNNNNNDDDDDAIDVDDDDESILSLHNDHMKQLSYPYSQNSLLELSQSPEYPPNPISSSALPLSGRPTPISTALPPVTLSSLQQPSTNVINTKDYPSKSILNSTYSYESSHSSTKRSSIQHEGKYSSSSKHQSMVYSSSTYETVSSPSPMLPTKASNQPSGIPTHDFSFVVPTRPTTHLTKSKSHQIASSSSTSNHDQLNSLMHPPNSISSYPKAYFDNSVPTQSLSPIPSTPQGYGALSPRHQEVSPREIPYTSQGQPLPALHSQFYQSSIPGVELQPQGTKGKPSESPLVVPNLSQDIDSSTMQISHHFTSSSSTTFGYSCSPHRPRHQPHTSTLSTQFYQNSTSSTSQCLHPPHSPPSPHHQHTPTYPPSTPHHQLTPSFPPSTPHHQHTPYPPPSTPHHQHTPTYPPSTPHHQHTPPHPPSTPHHQHSPPHSHRTPSTAPSCNTSLYNEQSNIPRFPLPPLLGVDPLFATATSRKSVPSHKQVNDIYKETDMNSLNSNSRYPPLSVHVRSNTISNFASYSSCPANVQPKLGTKHMSKDEFPLFSTPAPLVGKQGPVIEESRGSAIPLYDQTNLYSNSNSYSNSYSYSYSNSNSKFKFPNSSSKSPSSKEKTVTKSTLSPRETIEEPDLLIEKKVISASPRSSTLSLPYEEANDEAIFMKQLQYQPNHTKEEEEEVNQQYFHIIQLIQQEKQKLDSINKEMLSLNSRMCTLQQTKDIVVRGIQSSSTLIGKSEYKDISNEKLKNLLKSKQNELGY